MLVKSCLMLVAALASLQASSSGGSQKFTQAPTIKLQAQKAFFVVGEPIIIDVNLINTTSKEVLVFEIPGAKNAETFAEVCGFDSNGQPLRRSSYGDWLQKGPVVPLSRILRTLLPGHSLNESMDVSQVFDISHAGLYRFQVKRQYLFNGSVDVDSNTVTVEIK